MTLILPLRRRDNTVVAVSLIDDADADLLDVKWNVNREGYAWRHPARDRYEYVHRMLVDCPPSMEVDHINGDTLDNRRSNLRVVTKAENQQNRHRYKGFRGVYYDKGASGRTKPWRAILHHNKKREHLGRFDNAADAELAVWRRRYELGSPVPRRFLYKLGVLTLPTHLLSRLEGAA